ncbi:HAD-IA family hydrolase, partial [Pseudonocardia oceani]
FGAVPYGAGRVTPVLRALVMDYGGVLTDGPEVLDLVRRARVAGHPTALVSDAHVVPDDVAALFDLLVLGPALGVRKPDPEVFRRTAGRLGVGAGECVVVDDLAANVRGARAAGAVVVHHVDAATTVDEVEVLLGLPEA